MDDFQLSRFLARINEAQKQVALLLDSQYTSALPSSVHHTYADKFRLAEQLINTYIAAIITALGVLGMSSKLTSVMRDWAQQRSVTICLSSELKCKFVEKVIRKETDATQRVTVSNFFGVVKSFLETEITEYIWRIEGKYEFTAYPGTDTEQRVIISNRFSTGLIKTPIEAQPIPSMQLSEPIEANITWLLQHLDEKGNPRFQINRSVQSCRTPRRNEDVDRALASLATLSQFCDQVIAFLRNNWATKGGAERIGNEPLVDRKKVVQAIVSEEDQSSGGVFVPCVSLVEVGKQEAAAFNLLGSDMLLAAQRKSLFERIDSVSRALPLGRQEFAGGEEVQAIVVLRHIQQVMEYLQEGLDYIEFMLHAQLVAAIGKGVTPVDLYHYQRFHNRKLYTEHYGPRPFAHCLRRANHHPEGVLSIEADLKDGSMVEPIQTFACHGPMDRPLRIPINAATEVLIKGERYLHGHLRYEFAGSSSADLTLHARANQHSFYIVMLGTMGSADLFIPKYGILVRDKDQLRIPLNMETIPSAKEFRDAIESMSPEQQRFAKAYRSMQIEATLFCICVVQLKGQMERLLALEPDALTKDLDLMRQVMDLFRQFDVPPDVLAYSGSAAARGADKVAQVKANVSRIMGMIEAERQAEIRQKEMERRMRLAEAERRRKQEAEEAERRRIEEERRRREEAEEAARWRNEDRTIVYAVVARTDATVLAETVPNVSFFKRTPVKVFVQQALEKVGKDGPTRMTYSINDNYFINMLRHDVLIFISLSPFSTSRRIGFTFLDEIKLKFITAYERNTWVSAAAHGLSEFAAAMSATADHLSNEDKILRIQRELDEVKAIMVQNIDHVLARGDRMALLEEQSMELSSEAFQFKSKATVLKKKIWWGSGIASGIAAIGSAVSSATSSTPPQSAKLSRPADPPRPAATSAPFTTRIAEVPPAAPPEPAAALAPAVPVEAPVPVVDAVPIREARAPDNLTLIADLSNAANGSEQVSNLIPTEQKKTPPAPPEAPSPADTKHLSDMTQIASGLERAMDSADTAGAVRPTIISAGKTWRRQRFALLSAEPEATLETKDLDNERTLVYNLLDIVTKSGAMVISEVELHVVVAATHCFEKTLMGTLVQESRNPIEDLERSGLIMGSVVHAREPLELVRAEHAQRIAQTHANLLEG